MRYFFRKMLFFEIFWTFKFDQKFEPKSRNCWDSNDSQYKDKFQTVELVLQSSLSRRFLCICIHWNWKTTSSLSTHLGKKSRDNKTEALLAIHEVKIAYNEQSKKDFAVSFDEIFNEIVVLAEILSTQNSWLESRFSPSKTRNSIKLNEYRVFKSINSYPFTSRLYLFDETSQSTRSGPTHGAQEKPKESNEISQ